MHKVKITGSTHPQTIQIYLDDRKVEGCKAFNLKASVDSELTITLDLIVDTLELEGETVVKLKPEPYKSSLVVDLQLNIEQFKAGLLTANEAIANIKQKMEAKQKVGYYFKKGMILACTKLLHKLEKLYQKIVYWLQVLYGKTFYQIWLWMSTSKFFSKLLIWLELLRKQYSKLSSTITTILEKCVKKIEHWNSKQ